MSTYRATVQRDGRFWFIDVEGVGATQARHLREVEDMARDLIVVMEEVDPAEVELEVDIQVPEPVRQHLQRAMALREESQRANAAAASEVREAARELSSTGMALRDIGQLLGVSYQRAHQLVRSA